MCGPPEVGTCKGSSVGNFSIGEKCTWISDRASHQYRLHVNCAKKKSLGTLAAGLPVGLTQETCDKRGSCVGARLKTGVL